MKKKIILIGSGGAGKSTLARKIGEKLDIEVYHLDALLWKPNWQQVSREEQRSIQEKIVQKKEWVIDGNYGGTMDIRLKAADTIIFMDIHRIICVYRALKRFFQYRSNNRPDMVEGNDEKIDLKFYQWIWNYPRDKRPEILQNLEKLADEKSIVILKTPKEVRNFVSNL